ncbi:MAG: hypothetical protein AAF191_06990 [Verrucomicrobiota bacterium]
MDILPSFIAKAGLLAPIAFVCWLIPFATFLILRKAGIEVWILALSILLFGLLPYTGHRYSFASLEGDASLGKPAKIFAELSDLAPPARRANHLYSLEASAPLTSLYLGTEDTPTWAKTPQPLIVLCASGGGITAEVWAYKMLHLLDQEIPEFRSHLRVITGASGGMVGASTWVARSSLGVPRSPEATFRGRNLDQLSQITQRLTLWDLSWGALLQRLPFPPFDQGHYQDRGNLLEQVWVEKFPSLGISLPELAASEHSGELPSLIYAPMLAQDGRRLLTSNLDLSPLRYAGWGSEGPRHRVRSSLLTSSQALEDVPLTTWARMGATFPIVSPAASLPQRRDHPDAIRNAVDAGYYDNSGTNLAVSWLRECYVPWLDQALDDPNSGCFPPTSILIIELDAYPRLPEHPQRHRKFTGNLFIEDVRQVFLGASNRSRSTHFRNDEEIEAFGRFSKDHNWLADIPLYSARFTCDSGASLSWALTERERDSIFDNANRTLETSEFQKLAERLAQE